MGASSEAEDWNALGERIAAQAVQLDLATHRLLSDLRRFDEAGAWHRQGFMSCAHWLSFRVGWDLATSRERVRVAKALGGLPKVDCELASGKLSYCKARAISRVATPKIEETLLAYAAVCTGSQLETICRKYRAVEKRCADPRQPLPKSDERFITTSQISTGMVCVKAVMRADEASLLIELVEAAARACKTEGSATKDRRALHRTFNRVDGLMTILQTYARGESPQRTPVEMIITTPAEVLHRAEVGDRSDRSDGMKVPGQRAPAPAPVAAWRRRSATGDEEAPAEMQREHAPANNNEAPAETPADASAEASAEAPAEAPRPSQQDRGGNIPVAIVATTHAYLDAETARRLACDCGIVEATVDQRGEPLSIGRKSRTLPAAIKRALLLRDRTCRFPGCDHRLFLDGHHIRHWADGGETSLENTLLLCSTHHSYVHERGYRVLRSEAGDLTFLDPRGTPVRAVAPRPTPPESAHPAAVHPAAAHPATAHPAAAHPAAAHPAAAQNASAEAQRVPGSWGRLDHAEAIGRLMAVQGLRAPRAPARAAPVRVPVAPVAPIAPIEHGPSPAFSPAPVKRGCFGADPDYDYDEWGQRPYDLEKWATETILATGEDPTATVPAPVWPPVSWYLSKGREPPESMNYRGRAHRP